MTPQALQHLPRDARDTLFSLAVVAWTLLPHAAHVAPWCSALAALTLAWRAWLAVAQRPLPPRWQLAALLALACALTLWSQRTLLGKEAGVTMLVVLLALKTLELRARRDAMVLLCLGFFLVLTQFLYSQSIAIAASMLVSVWGLLTALVLANLPVGRPPLRRAAATAARLAALGAPVMLVLFLLFPRIGPLWGLPQDAAGRTGLSGSLRLGGIASLALDETIAMRVRFLDAVPEPGRMYFRGPVLTVYDGRDWTPAREGRRLRVAEPVEVPAGATALRYEATLEPSRLTTLPLLELSTDVAAEELAVRQRHDLEWVAAQPLAQRVRLQGRAWTDARHGPTDATPSLAEHLLLPPQLHPRTRAWALELRRQLGPRDGDAMPLVDAVLRHLRDGGFGYTLEPGPYLGDTIDEFWMERKLGFCEHFASAFVVVMRAAGVPARIVTGYQGSDPRPVDGYFVVRQSYAHAWAEVWQAGRGWVRVDPTAAVAPDRVQRSAALLPAPGLVGQALGAITPELRIRLRQWWEAVDNRWNQFVLSYSSQRQFDLLRGLGIAAPTWQDLAQLLAALVGLAAAAGAVGALWDRHRQDPWQRLQQRIRRRLAALGVEVQDHHGPRARAALVRQALGERGEALARELDAMDRSRYAQGPGVRVDRHGWRRIRDAARQVEAALRNTA